MDLLCFFCLVFAMPFHASFICALWSPARKGLTFGLWCLLLDWYPGSGVVLDCIDY